jgi:hypothetical protein
MVALLGGRAHSVFSQVRRMAEHELRRLMQIREALDGAP